MGTGTGCGGRNHRDALRIGSCRNVRRKEQRRARAFRKRAIRRNRKNVKSIALREVACGIGLMVDDIESFAARIEGEFKVRGFARAVEDRQSNSVARPARTLGSARGAGDRPSEKTPTLLVPVSAV